MNIAMIKRLALKGIVLARKSIPYTLAAVSAASTVALVVTTIQEAEKKDPEVIEEKSIPKKAIRIVKKYYKPILFAAGSVTAQGLSVYIFNKRQKQLIIATEQMQALLQKYTNAALATAGVGGTQLLNNIQPTEPDELTETPEDDGLTLFWDPIFEYWFRADEKDFIRAAYETSMCFSCNGETSVNAFYERMGVEPPTDPHGHKYNGWGWYWDDDWVSSWREYSGYINIDYSPIMCMDDGMEYRLVNYMHDPQFYEDMLMSPW